MIWQTGLRRDLCAGRVELAPAQRLKQIAHEDDALSLAAGKTFANEEVDAHVHGRAHLAAEAAVRERCRPAVEEPAVEPGRTVRFHLRFNAQIRAVRAASCARS